MQQLENEYIVHGNTFRLVKRTDTKAMYKSDDGVVEVFRIKILPEQEIYGKLYPEREQIPVDESFGVNSWCYSSDYKAAEIRYQSL